MPTTLSAGCSAGGGGCAGDKDSTVGKLEQYAKKYAGEDDAFGAMSDSAQSRVAGKFAVSPMPTSGEPGGRSTATLGGGQLARHAPDLVGDELRLVGLVCQLAQDDLLAVVDQDAVRRVLHQPAP